MKIFNHIIICILVALIVPACDGAAESPIQEGVKADKVVLEKGKRHLTALANGQPLKTFKVSLGGNPVGPKEREGDQKTPEGNYTIDYRKSDSRYHRALHISYPSPADIKRAKQAGVAPGGAIMIHGLRNGLGWLGRLHRFFDWTQGCIAVTNSEIEELWQVIPDGTPIEIKQ